MTARGGGSRGAGGTDPLRASRTARAYWSSRIDTFQDVPGRLRHVAEWILPRLPERLDTLSDLGCGSGRMSLLVTQLVEVRRVLLVDISDVCLKEAEGLWGPASRRRTRIEPLRRDLAGIRGSLPPSDLGLFLGVMLYLIRDEQVDNLLRSCSCRQLIVRTPCTLKPEDEVIDVYSEAVRGRYAANYRTLDHTVSLLSRHYTVSEVERIYPDELESKFGNRQFIFNCFRREG